MLIGVFMCLAWYWALLLLFLNLMTRINLCDIPQTHGFSFLALVHSILMLPGKKKRIPENIMDEIQDSASWI